MAARKIKDVAVKTGKYSDRNTGESKGRYQNVGALMESDDGSMFILLQRWFNPAGIASERETILLTCFEPREPNERSGGGGKSTGGRPGKSAGPDDDIPF